MGDSIGIVSLCIDLFSKDKIRHPRIFLRSIIAFAFMFIFIIFYKVGWISGQDTGVLIILFVITCLYLYIAYHAAMGPIGLSRVKLKKIEKLIAQGQSWDRDDLFLKKPFYLIDYAEIYRYALLQADYLMERSEFKKAYEIYSSIDEKKLFQDEKNDLNIKKACVLFNLGDMNRAKILLEKTIDQSSASWLLIRSLINEQAGDMDKAYECLQYALSTMPGTETDKMKANIFSHFGRIKLMENNITDVIYYYKKAVDAAKRSQNKRQIHACFQNLIHAYLLNGDDSASMHSFNEYEMLIDRNCTQDVLELNNLKVEVYRQKMEHEELGKQIIESYDLRNKVDGVKKLFLHISILRMMFNAGMNLELVLDEIATNIQRYNSMQMPERYLALKEVISVIEAIMNMPEYLKYMQMYLDLLAYMTNQAYLDIENYIEGLAEYEVLQRCSMETEKVIILKKYAREYDFDRIYVIMKNIRDIYKSNGNFINMISTNLNIADECIVSGSFTTMQDHVELVEENIKGLKNHPAMREYTLRLSYYNYVLGKKDKANDFFKAFKETNISVSHFAYWLQEYYYVLKGNLVS
ncbi:MAG: hypothetical protein PHG06_16675 [Parabacteroides sp.]|nr:hypothetical protein [Parabacteroides sp.]